jgi:hypothetical protein
MISFRCYKIFFLDITVLIAITKPFIYMLREAGNKLFLFLERGVESGDDHDRRMPVRGREEILNSLQITPEPPRAFRETARYGFH